MAPEPLRALLDKLERAAVDLAEGVNTRETMHALRSALSDICALTETNPKVLRAVRRVAVAGERLAEMAALPPRSRTEIAARSAVARALASLTAALVDTRPSRIAVSLGRGW
ncbi:hypothetical protein [Methylobacterium nonmethylotrophicum]|uniref:Uncharacterized protein n=1 Tax=Methylobacterium nonmethylotrophicum TaxID=1141884 RepID=A0A4Z0NJW6_9HYPH|nr:hypothetical protein [Methylobacterium nonmethylotrophicum]TGD96446.1 hypothetical protein EU555_23590 [Methylobacterium nonmethylotrophicum]